MGRGKEDTCVGARQFELTWRLRGSHIDAFELLRGILKEGEDLRVLVECDFTLETGEQTLTSNHLISVQQLMAALRMCKRDCPKKVRVPAGRALLRCEKVFGLASAFQ